MKFNIRSMVKEDWQEVSNIYLEGIKTRKATFQSIVPLWEEWSNSHIENCSIVAYIEDEIIGWAALSKVSNRCVYVGVSEVSVYIKSTYKKLGVGVDLLNNLIDISEQYGIWSLQSTIIEENLGSIKLHKKVGFREIGFKEKIAKMNSGKWHNVILMERRSKKIGID